MRTLTLTLVVVAGSWLVSSPVAAQTSGGPVDLQLASPAIDTKGLVTLNGSDVLGHLDPSFGLELPSGIVIRLAEDASGVEIADVVRHVQSFAQC